MSVLVRLKIIRPCLETFLSGMETRGCPLYGFLSGSLETFLSGMETGLRRVPVILESGLETFLSGMETRSEDGENKLG